MPLVSIVEDDPGVANFLKRALRLEGYDVNVWSDGQVFLNHADATPFDVLIVDHDLPGRNGLEIVQWLARRTPIPAMVMLTGREQPGLKQTVLEAGAQGFQLKPVDLDDLLLLVAGLVKA
jgi:two-component system, OmpR family, response regulator MprA